MVYLCLGNGQPFYYQTYEYRIVHESRSNSSWNNQATDRQTKKQKKQTNRGKKLTSWRR